MAYQRKHAEDSRPKRVPLHEQRRNRLTILDRDPAYMYRIVNDTENRVASLKLAGYEIVEKVHEIGDPNVIDNNTTLGSGTRVSVGGGIQGVLMRIPKELYEEDQEAKQKAIDRTEAELIKRPNGADGAYGEVSISRNK